MADFRKHFKSKKFILLFSMILTTICIAFFKIFLNYPYIRLELIILPVLSLIWGPCAILGFTIVEIAYHSIFHPEHSLFNLLSIFLLFTTNFAVWKMWYSIMNKYGPELPNSSRFYNLIKLLIIYLIYAAIIYILFNFMSHGIINNTLTDTFIMSIPVSYFITIFSLYIVHRFKIPMHSPQKQFKQILPKKIYPLLLISFMGVGILYILNNNKDYYHVLGLISLILLLLYLLKPYDKNVFKIKQDMTLNIFNKVNISIFLIIIILIIILEIIDSNSDYLMQDPVMLFFRNALLLFVFMITLGLIYMYVLEIRVTNPINRLSEIVSNRTITREDYLEHKKNLESINANNEIKTLIDSLEDMENDFIEYGENLVKVTAEKEKYETELKLASDIQNSMIRKDFEEFYNSFNENKNSFELWGLMKAAREVGGDFYDYFKIDEENIGFVIGDVSGKGISAALIMVKAMTLIQDYAKHYKDLSKVFFEVNNQLCEDNMSLFVTCWIGKLNIKTKELSFVNAGHDSPLIKSNNNSFEYLNSEHNLVLGAMENIPYETQSIQLNEEDMIFLCTDGITEANDNYKEFYGKERLKGILNEHKNDKLRSIIESVTEDVDEFCNHKEQFDDMTMFIIKIG